MERDQRSRFPLDFMFEMSDSEFISWRSHFVISKKYLKGLRYAPFCFTEQEVTMLSCIINSERAIAVNIQIIRIFTKLREMLVTHKELVLKIEEFERKLGKQDEKMALIFNYLKQFVDGQIAPRRKIGFKQLL
jgi:hypothetical protein